MGRTTFSLSDPYDGQAFIQVRYRPHQAAADVVFLAPSLAEQEQMSRAWSRLLDGACIEAAGQGIQRVFASLPLSGEEVEVFQQTGFTVYAREDIFWREPQPGGPAAKHPPTLRPQRVDDWPAIQKLCVSITPQRVRQAEGGIALTAYGEQSCQRYVVPDKSDSNLVAALTVCAGGQAHWLRVLVHPNMHDQLDEYTQSASPPAHELDPKHQQGTHARPEQEDVDNTPANQANALAYSLIDYGLSRLSAEPAKPVYCNLRQYESGVRHALQAAGFELWNQRVLSVKHTVAWSKTPAQDAVPVLKRSAEPVGPTTTTSSLASMASQKRPLKRVAWSPRRRLIEQTRIEQEN
jgi:hypothetical protein